MKLEIQKASYEHKDYLFIVERNSYNGHYFIRVNKWSDTCGYSICATIMVRTIEEAEVEITKYLSSEEETNA